MANSYKMPWDDWQAQQPSQAPAPQSSNNVGHNIMSFGAGVLHGVGDAVKNVASHPIESAKKAPGAAYDNFVKPSVDAAKNLPQDFSGLAHGTYHAAAGVLAGDNHEEGVKQLKLADDAFSHTFLGNALHPLVQKALDDPTKKTSIGETLNDNTTKQALAHVAGKTGEELLNLTAPLMGGKVKEKVAGGMFKEAAKDGLIQGGKFGAAYGGSEGLQEDNVTAKGVGEHIATGTLAGGLLGGVVGGVLGTHASINHALDHEMQQFDHMHIAAMNGAMHGGREAEQLALPAGDVPKSLPATSSANPVKTTAGEHPGVFGMHEISPQTQEQIQHLGQIIHAYKAEGPRIDDVQSIGKVQLLRNQAAVTMENLAADRYQMMKGAHDGQLENSRGLLRDIKSTGGIKTDPAIKEEMAHVPLHVRSKDGYAPDDMAQLLESHGHQFNDGAHLLDYIKSARDHIQSQMSDDHIIERAHSQLATGTDEASLRYQQAAKLGTLADLKYKELMGTHKVTDVYHAHVTAEDAAAAKSQMPEVEAKAGAERIDGPQPTPAAEKEHAPIHQLVDKYNAAHAEGTNSVGQLKMLNELIEHPSLGNEAKAHYIEEREALKPGAAAEAHRASMSPAPETTSTPMSTAKTPQDVVTPQGNGAGEKPPVKPAAASSKEPNPAAPGELNNDPTTDKASAIDKVVRSAQGLIAKQGENGKKLAKLLQKQDDDHEMQHAKWLNQLPTFQKLKGKDVERFWDAAEGKKGLTASKKVMKAVEEWKAVRPQILEAAKKAGLDIKDLGETYLPHSHSELLSSKKGFNEAVAHLVKTGQAKNEAEAIRALRSYRDETHNRRFGNLEESRRYNLPGYDKTKGALLDYMENASKRISQVENFGKNDEKAFQLLADIKAEGKDAEAAHNAFNVSVGAKKYNNTAMDVSGKVRGAMAVTKLGRAAISNASQTGNTGIVTGHIRTATQAIKYWSGANKLDKESQDLLHESGVISDSIISHIKEQYGFGKLTSKVAAPAFNTVEKGNRAIAFHAGVDWANTLAKRGKTDILRDKLGIEGEIGKKLTRSQQMQAGRKVVEIAQFKVKPKDLPGWADSPQGKIATQFKSFSYKQSEFVMNEVLKPLKKGNVVPLARLMALLPVGYGVYEAKRVATGMDTSKDNQDSPEAKIMNAWGAMGGGGLATDVPNQLQQAATAKNDPEKKTLETIAGIAGGPATSEVAKTADNAVQAIGGNAKPLEKQAISNVPVVGSYVANKSIPYTQNNKAYAGGNEVKDKGGDKLRYMQDLKLAGDETYNKFFASNPDLDPTSNQFGGYKNSYVKGGGSGGSSSSKKEGIQTKFIPKTSAPKRVTAKKARIKSSGKPGKITKSQVTNHLTRKKSSRKRAA